MELGAEVKLRKPQKIVTGVQRSREAEFIESMRRIRSRGDLKMEARPEVVGLLMGTTEKAKIDKYLEEGAWKCAGGLLGYIAGKQGHEEDRITWRRLNVLSSLIVQFRGFNKYNIREIEIK